MHGAVKARYNNILNQSDYNTLGSPGQWQIFHPSSLEYKRKPSLISCQKTIYQMGQKGFIKSVCKEVYAFHMWLCNELPNQTKDGREIKVKHGR